MINLVKLCSSPQSLCQHLSLHSPDHHIISQCINEHWLTSCSRHWKLTLVVFTMILLTVLTVVVFVIIDVRLKRRILEIYEATSNIAKNVLRNIRDIFASTAEASIFAQYDQLLVQANKLRYKKASATAFQYFFELFFLCCGYSLIFWYDSMLYSRDGVSIGSIITYVVFHVSIFMPVIEYSKAVDTMHVL